MKMEKWRKKWKLTKTAAAKELHVDRRSIFNYEEYGYPKTVEYAMKWLDYVWSKKSAK